MAPTPAKLVTQPGTGPTPSEIQKASWGAKGLEVSWCLLSVCVFLLLFLFRLCVLFMDRVETWFHNCFLRCVGFTMWFYSAGSSYQSFERKRLGLGTFHHLGPWRSSDWHHKYDRTAAQSHLIRVKSPQNGNSCAGGDRIPIPSTRAGVCQQSASVSAASKSHWWSSQQTLQDLKMSHVIVMSPGRFALVSDV